MDASQQVPYYLIAFHHELQRLPAHDQLWRLPIGTVTVEVEPILRAWQRKDGLMAIASGPIRALGKQEGMAR